MAAVTPDEKPYFAASAWEHARHRVVWLLILMLSAAITGSIITRYEDAISAVPLLVAFLPMLMDTGGNCGSQASVSVIRGISLNEIQFSDLFRVIWKEIRVSVICGITLAAANFAKLMLIDRMLFQNQMVTIPVAAVICGTMVCTVICAKLVGCSLPLLAKKLHFDPAVMASPFISTIVDSLSLLIYFRFASLFLGL